jgi:hypothetical protein
MLDNRYQRGFTQQRLTSGVEPRVRKDERGYYIMSLSENTKVYFDDFYRFLETTYLKAINEKAVTAQKFAQVSDEQSETVAYYRAKTIVSDLLLKTVRRFYTDGANFGVVMSPWCFGTVMLEKVEAYRDRLARGEVEDANVGEYPYYVIKYIDEIYRVELLAMFDFPEKAFEMRWQYSELLKRYSKVLSDITTRLGSVLKTVKNLGS